MAKASKKRIERAGLPQHRRQWQDHSDVSHGSNAKARECEELAQGARDPFIQQQMQEVAEKWRTMAAFEEKFGR